MRWPTAALVCGLLTLAACARNPAQAAANRAAHGDFRLLVTAYAQGPDEVVWIAPGINCADPLYAPIEPVMVPEQTNKSPRDLIRMRDFNFRMVHLAGGHEHARCHAVVEPDNRTGGGYLGGSSVAEAVAAVSLDQTLAQRPRPGPKMSTLPRPTSVKPESRHDEAPAGGGSL